VLVLGLLAAGAGAVRAADDPACGVTTLVAAAGADHYTLAHGFIRAGSDSVWTRRGPMQRDHDYVLDRLRGQLRVLTSTVPGETLWVQSCWLLAPPPLEYSRQRYRPVPAAPAPAAPDTAAPPPARPSTGRDIVTAPGGSALTVTGNKTIAVEFGSSQDAALRQSLDLAVGGTLAPGIELTGVLSDRNTPLSAVGSTQDLQSLDRVLLELRAPHAAAALGDVPLSIERGQFARLDRQVQGARGDWSQGGFTGSIAAASSRGEYFRLQLNGVEGLQGPYQLTDRDGAVGISVVAASEIVTLDGQRMSRGESADYSMDYERGRLTFTNRRPITAASRITIEYQYALTRYRRNLSMFSGEWRATHARLFATAVTESDDRGRPLDAVLDANDLAALAAAGDSASRALGPGLLPGPGDYDTLRVGHDSLIVAFAGLDSGTVNARFTRVGLGAGDYVDSAIVSARVIYHWVGPGLGTFVLGRALPLPESHQLVTLGGAATAGPLTLEAEGAMSRLDLNTASSLDDRDNGGGAGRLAMTLEGRAGPLPGRAGLQAGVRSVDRSFAPFSRLERPFAEQDWGLPVGADLEHQRRTEGSAYWRPVTGSELNAAWARLVTPDGFTGERHGASWSGGARDHTHLEWLEADGRLATVHYTQGGRRHLLGDATHNGRLFVPTIHFEIDDRRTPSDTAPLRDRVQELGGDLGSGTSVPWKTSAGITARLDRHAVGAVESSQRSTTFRLAEESPTGAAFGAGVTAQHRITRDEGTATSTGSDLASVRLRGEKRPWGLSGQLDVELTKEADNQRLRTLTFVGTGLGHYDSFGNFVGTGDYDLVLVVSPVLQGFTRTATSARTGWAFGSSETWRGSRVDFTLEDEARRTGHARLADVFLSTGLALVDPTLARASITQRIEAELAPGSHLAALHARAERRVTADRTYGNFAQTNDQRLGSLRWRVRPGAALTVESNAQVNWQSASQQIPGAGQYARTIVDEAGSSQLAWQASTSLRIAGTLELDRSRPLSQREATQTVRIGPDVSAGIGSRGHADFTLRRAFESGAAAVALLPSAEPAGFARWDGTARFDLRLHETTTFGVSGTLRDRPGRATVVTGRAEVRAFF
jgi:hypothetical protein